MSPSRRRGAERGDKHPRPSAVYVYAVVQNRTRPRVPRRSRLPNAAPPRAVSAASGRWAIVSDVPADEYSGGTVRARLSDVEWVSRCALAHQAVVAELLACDAVIPMRLFAVFRSEDAAMSKLRRTRGRLDAVLARVRGRDEWVVRARVRPRPTQLAPVQENGSPGAAYLARKQRLLEQHETAGPSPEARAALTALVEELRDVAVQTARPRGGPDRTRAGPPAFLVDRRRASAFRARVRNARGGLRRLGIDVELVGPWPPYSFVS